MRVRAAQILTTACALAIGAAAAGQPSGGPPWGAPMRTAKLKLGDAAPPITVTEWVKGKPFDMAKDGPGKVIVLDFWATWCGPCIQMIPESNAVYQRYRDKGLVFIAHTDTGSGQTLKTVQEFVSKQGDRMSYPIAFEASQKTNELYVMGTGGVGIPHAVVIGKDGKIAWVGHPGEPEMREVIEALLLDKFDLGAVTARKARQARVEPIMNNVQEALYLQDWPKCLSLLDQVLAINPADGDAMRVRAIICLERMKAPAAHREWAEKYIEDHRSDSEALSKVADTLLASPTLSQRLPELAVRAAKLAGQADSKSLPAAQTLATVYFQIGAVDKAIEAQKKAVEIADVFRADEARETLAYYETCKKLQSETASQ